MSLTDREINPIAPSGSELAVPVTIMFALLLLAFVGMWWGWRRRARRHDLPELVAVPAAADLPTAGLTATARYFGTTISGSWLDRVVARGLGTRSTAHLALSTEGLDVVRPADSFRITAEALHGARHDQGIAGKVVPPHGLLIVTWRHGDHLLDSGFRVTDTSATETHNTWIHAISTLVENHKEHTA